MLSAERRIRSDALGGMAEDIVGLVIGLSLVGYLLYALARPERF
ncbi:MAG: K(+)-transporting ATPase subunit F [Actinomycetales bacterium]|uniref:K(+)-transporting ATPase subunit F n=1 Tax=Candidatus Phosphoribacter hodrii TaxID=2953743 RepID=A0A935IX50_9MICO|nr:K(+)-transporting ATPase subunit F [Candidatus Phosphoribacter hodrii]MBP8837736.1 K(+)-transporting ATPase subunit F [Dermatophilaceae bacterium]MBK7274323.1 K(+)-transporting ATPase subunit F [Candidatus Phosphoribacter hodrii]HNV13647.1 K(+)-transporting ATPase subunit F [Dermatophilaceae bacterium]HOA01621.1 K(+)-transporting ATPase subunit F [Dermatophilaceae bacterium]